jgi:hypothetical protein
LSAASRAWLRRAAYALFALSVLNVIFGVGFLVFGLTGPADRRTLAITEAIVNVGFAMVNGMLGLAALFAGRRSV